MIAVVYIVREAAAARRFVESYRAHRAGCWHKLVFLCKGARACVPDNAAGLEYEELRISDWGYDLRAYRVAAKKLTWASFICGLNSHTRIVADGWLRDLNSLPFRNGRNRELRAGRHLVTATWTSEESFYTNNPTWWRRLLFPPAPNFHFRSNGFLISRRLLLEVWPRVTLTKWLCYLAESGRWSITRRLRKRGVVIVSVPPKLEDNRRSAECGVRSAELKTATQ